MNNTFSFYQEKPAADNEATKFLTFIYDLEMYP
jgi:hypothetical protein